MTPVACIGASAGGLEALKILLANLPADTDLAFVFVQHLDPKHHSDLTEILSRVSPIPVQQARDGHAIEPNQLYVIPPDTQLEMESQLLKITPRAPASSGPHTPIDRFLRSLAQECGSRAIGIILSGAGTDGASGLEAVKTAGGVTFVQDPATAKFDSMPQAAIARGCVDFVLSPEAIASELTRLGRHPYIAENGSDDAGSLDRIASLKDQFDPILALLRDATGIDFALYRENTVQRRILRRLALHNLGSLEDYRKRLENDPRELSALHRDLLINVTNFFRDPESFEHLKQLVFPRLIEHRPEDAAIRIWVAGCATGEEAYSFAISLNDFFEERGHSYPVQIFGSDLSSTAIERARSGRFGEAIAADVGPERLSRYFSKVEGGYQISKTLRDMCIFSRHDLLHDPPFSKLDLISCQNVLIFFGSVRKNVIARFHYALNPGGFLVLGRSESESSNLFSLLEGTHNIYTKLETVGKRRMLYAAAVGPRRNPDAYGKIVGIPVDGLARGIELRKELEGALLSRYSGAGVVVDEALEVIETIGQTAPYLELPSGQLSYNLLKLIPETRLFLEVEKLAGEVMRSGQSARKDRIPYQSDGAAGQVNVEVVPLGGMPPRARLVLFEPATGISDTPREPASDPKDAEIATLKQDLADARERLLAMIEEHQSSEQETQDASEEAISVNEELRSLNEELETAKEELQSTNEELITVNQELLSNNAALTEARDFAMLIIETAAAPLLVLDQELRIKAANPAFYRAFQISPAEAERQYLYSISKGCWDIPRLRDMLQHVLPDKKAVKDFEIERDFPGVGPKVLRLSARQLNGLERILLGIEDVTESQERDLRLTAIVDSSDDAIYSKTLDGKIVTWNPGAERIYGYAAYEIIGQPISTLAPSAHRDETSAIMERIRRGEKIRHFETKRRRKNGEVIDVSLTISPIVSCGGVIAGASIVSRDITDIKRAQEASLAKQKLETVGTLAAGIAHDFNNLLGGVLAHAELAMSELASGSRPETELQSIRAAAIRGAEIVRLLMIYAGQEAEILELVDVSRIVEDMLELLKIAVSKRAAIESDLAKDLPAVRANPGKLQQVVMNLITNASEAIGDRDGVIRVTTRRAAADKGLPAGMQRMPEPSYVQLEVSDTGCGMSAETQARIFDPFFTTKPSGHGLGLAVVQGIVRGLGGTIRVVSAPGKGTKFQILLPCAEPIPPIGLNANPGESGQVPQSLQGTILVAEDEDLLRQGVSKILRKMGFSVIEASDGSAALDQLRSKEDEINLLFLDITLPGASSREVFEEAKRLRPDMAVVVTSAYSQEMAASTLNAKVEHFIRKPFRLSDVVDIRESGRREPTNLLAGIAQNPRALPA